MDETLTREERIRKYAEEWYKIRLVNGISGSAKTDWEKAEHIVDSEDKVKMIEDMDKYLHTPSKAKCSTI
jgi:threonyl-tRNA synthetase